MHCDQTAKNEKQEKIKLTGVRGYILRCFKNIPFFHKDTGKK